MTQFRDDITDAIWVDYIAHRHWFTTFLCSMEFILGNVLWNLS